MKAGGVMHFVRNHVRGISPKAKINFFRQMGILTNSGISILKALKLMHKSVRGNMRYLLRDSIALIEQGNDFSKIGLYYVAFFDKTTVAMIKAGEKSGNLPTILKQIFLNLDKKAKFKKKIIGAMMMPTLTFLIAVGVIFFMAIKVIPEFSKFLSTMGADLPPITQLVLNISSFLLAYWKDILLYIGAGVFTMIFLYKSIKVIKYYMDYLFIFVPLMGSIAFLGSLTSFSNSMSTLLKSGVGMVESIKISNEGVLLLPLKKVIENAQTKIIAGGTLSSEFEKAHFIPIIFKDLLQSGEESGSMDETFAQLATIYEEETEQRIAILQTAIQPIMTILIGGVVGVIAASLILGMISMWSTHS